MLVIMRIAFIKLVLLFMSGSFLYANDTKGQEYLNKEISLQENSITLRAALNKIEKAAKVKFSYSRSLINLNQEVSFSANSERLSELLKRLFKPLLIDYQPLDNQILLFNLKNEKAQSLISDGYDMPLLSIQSPVAVIIKGRVLSASSNLPLMGVSIIEKGTSNGTSTDENGNFSINVASENAVLIISSVGYASKEVIAGKGAMLSILLESDIKSSTEVVVVGYGTQRRRDVTGAISKVSESAFKLVPIVSSDQALQGRAAGVQVTQSSGAPGGAVQVRIRGTNSTAGGGANQPLYVVDGVPLFYSEGANSLSIGNEGSTGGAASNAASPLNTISPNDIESIEVLKDASATAIYGARAANGVVLITTKSGRIGKPVISFNANYGMQSLRKKIPVTNAQERVAYTFEHRRNAGTRGNEVFDVFTVNPFNRGKGTDWQDEVFRNAPISNYNLSISGGSDRITYNVSGDYLDQQGILINTYFKRVGTRVNLDIKATERLKIGTRTTLNYQWENGSQNDEFFQGLLNGLTTLSPLLPVRDANGNYAGSPNALIGSGLYTDGGGNPVANQMERIRRADRYRIISNIYGEYTFNKHFKFKSSIGIDYLFTELRQVDPVWFRGINANSPVRVSEQSPKTYNWIAEQTLNFDQKFGEHTINAVLGFSAQNIRQKSLFASANGSVSNVLNQLGNQPTPSLVSGGITDQGLVSQFLRTNYSYKGKYLLTATVRRDGSSRFGGNNKYGMFPSGSIGWRLSEENFLKDNRTISDLKLRVSYGSVGSQEIGNFLYSALMGGTTAVFGNAYASGVVPTRFENADIRWERNNQFDVGIDVGLLKGRLNITADYYKKTTVGLLAGSPISVISGVGNTFVTNIGSVRNTGVELGVNAQLIDAKDFKWSLDFNISTNKNEVISLGSNPFINGQSVWRTNTFINRTEPGQPIGAFYILRNDGQYLNWADALAAPVYNSIGAQPYFAPGDLKIVDKNKDGKIDDDDREFYGSPFPDYFGGITSNISYKNWSFTVFAPFQHGNYVWNQPFLNASTFEGNVWRSIYDNRYQPSNPGVQTSIPIPRNNNPITPSDLYLQDGSFLRIRTLTLGYDFSAKQLSFLKMSKLHLFVQANNAFVFTKYQGWDPEANSFGSNVATNGIDIGAYPQARSFNVGANISF